MYIMKKGDVVMAKHLRKQGMSFRLPCICNLKSISVLSGCLSMPDATSLHHWPPEPSSILYYLELNQALNTNRPVANLAEAGL